MFSGLQKLQTRLSERPGSAIVRFERLEDETGNFVVRILKIAEPIVLRPGSTVEVPPIVEGGLLPGVTENKTVYIWRTPKRMERAALERLPAADEFEHMTF